MHTQLGSDRGVGDAVGGGQHDPGAEHVAMRARGRARARAVSADTIGVGQDDHERGSDARHDPLSARPPGQRRVTPRRCRRSIAPGARATMRHMAKIPDSTQTSLRQRLTDPGPGTLAPDRRGPHPLPGRVRLRRRRPGRRRDPAAVPAALRRLGRPLGLRDLPRQPRRLRRLLPAHRLHGRHRRRRPRHRLRPLPRRPHRLDLNPRRTNGDDH